MIKNHLKLLLRFNHTVKRLGQTSIICKEICTFHSLGELIGLGATRKKACRGRP
jgi:hypothetical protein